MYLLKNYINNFKINAYQQMVLIIDCIVNNPIRLYVDIVCKNKFRKQNNF